MQRPTLVICHNKTLAAQLYQEFKEFFPNNAVEYFVSYYDYYQPEAYIPRTDTYIEKDADINEEIDKLRHAATIALFERRDVVIVASVSCIYGLGEPEEYRSLSAILRKGRSITATNCSAGWWTCSTSATIWISRAASSASAAIPWKSSPLTRRLALRIEFFGDDRSTASCRWTRSPAKSERDWIRSTSTPPSTSSPLRTSCSRAIESIKEELADRLKVLKEQGKMLEAPALGAAHQL